MRREDIIRMAREAGFTEELAENWLGEVLVWEAEPKNLERFAALVAAHEREACAKVVEKCPWPKWAEGIDAREVFSAAIRSRGEVKP